MTTIPDDLLPVIFMGLMGLAMLLYSILDGFDLGTGILMAGRPEAQRDQMMMSIGPFWDANETWLVLGVGILLVAFPSAHGLILTTLYIPVALMLAGLILRGVSYEFRTKVMPELKLYWDAAFFFGSLLATISQGFMLGLYIVGFDTSWQSLVFAGISAWCVTSAYVLVGACWLVMKTQGELHSNAIDKARIALAFTGLGLFLVSIVNPLVSEDIYAKWFNFPNVIWLSLLPVSTVLLLLVLDKVLRALQRGSSSRHATPFFITIAIFVLSFAGLGYSFFPDIVPGKMDIWQAASAPESLRVILWGCIVVLPAIVAYSALAFWIFRGKTTHLSYS